MTDIKRIAEELVALTIDEVKAMAETLKEEYGIEAAHIELSAVENESMDFGQAIKALKAGKRVSRKGWNGKGMWLWCKFGTMIKSEWCKDEALKAIADANGGEIEGLPTICMKTADNKIVTGWLASQTDIMATDWCVLD